MIAGVLRALAIAIAVAAAIDPVIPMSARTRQRVALLIDPNASMPDLARTAHDALGDDLRRDFDVIAGTDATAAATVVVGSSFPDRPLPPGQRVFTMTAAPAATEADVRVTAVRLPRAVPRGTLIHLEADVDARNASGATTTLTIQAGRARVEVARVSHAWTKPSERWRASVDVTPVDEAPWLLHVEASAASGERALADNHADAAVLAQDVLRILVYEPRPSWPGAFVRRALESDARFAVGGISYPSRGVQITSGGARSLQSADLESIDAIVVGGLDRLTKADAAVVDRFIREREGAVILLPDSKSDLRAAMQWLPVMPAAAEVLLEKPALLTPAAPLPSFAASELLTFPADAPLRVLARAAGSTTPVVVELPYGGGHVTISGALDAWRYRADDGEAFDRFWRAAIAGAASASTPAIDLRIVPSVVGVGEEAQLRVRVRRSAFGAAASVPVRASAIVNGVEPIRLWPDSASDTFIGTFTAPPTEGVARADVTVDAGSRRSAQTVVAIARDVRSARRPGPPLALLAQSRGGVDVPADHVTELAQRLRHDIVSPRTRVERRPMRSTWWILPFTACLGGDWWLRRRRGLR